MISQKQLKTLMKKLKKRCIDGLSQEQLILGSRNLVFPPTTIINQFITDGEFHKVRKEALITPVLKKGNSELVANYRPVSCLRAASNFDMQSEVWLLKITLNAGLCHLNARV